MFQILIIIYGAAALIVCLFGFVVERRGIMPPIVYLAEDVGKYASIALLASIVGTFILTAERLQFLIAVAAVIYSLSRILRCYRQITQVCRLIERLECYIGNEAQVVDDVMYIQQAQFMKDNEVHGVIDAQYYPLYDELVVKLGREFFNLQEE